MSGKWAQKIQIGQESTAGTEVAATAIWCGMGPMLSDDREIVKPRKMTGLAVPPETSYTARLGGSWNMAETEATYQQLDYVLSAGLEDQITGTADGSGSSGYVRTYEPHGASNTALNSIQTFTIEGGDNTQAEKMEYAFVESFTLSQEMGSPVMVTANWLGRQVTNTTFTGALSLPTVEYLNEPPLLYIDDGGGTIGSTQVSNTIYKWSLEVTTGWVFDPPRDGNLYPDVHFWNQDAFSAKLSVTYKHNATTVLEKTDWRNETTRLIRLQLTGSAYGTAGSGTLFSGEHGFRLDTAGTYESFSALGEQDGASIYEAVQDIRYSSTDSLAFQIRLANEVATTP